VVVDERDGVSVVDAWLVVWDAEVRPVLLDVVGGGTEELETVVALVDVVMVEDSRVLDGVDEAVELVDVVPVKLESVAKVYMALP